MKPRSPQQVKEIEDNLKVKQNGFEMFKTNPNFRRAIGLGIGLQVIQQLTGINVVMYFAPTIFKIAGFATTNAEMWGTVIVGITNVLATFIAIAFVDKLGRKPIMYAGFVTMGLAMITVGTLFNMGIEKHPELGYFAIFALLIFIIGFAMSAGPIIWVICSEIYPLSGRDLGVTFSTATNWIANAIVGHDVPVAPRRARQRQYVSPLWRVEHTLHCFLPDLRSGDQGRVAGEDRGESSVGSSVEADWDDRAPASPPT